MNTNQNFVGSVRIKQVLQEIVKTSAGGMIAVSSAILFYWVHNDKPLVFNVLFMLSMHAFAIPLLAGARIAHAMLDGFERISEAADKHVSKMIEYGCAFAFVGYAFQIYFFSKVLAVVFCFGVALSIYLFYRFGKCIDHPQMVRKV